MKYRDRNRGLIREAIGDFLAVAFFCGAVYGAIVLANWVYG